MIADVKINGGASARLSGWRDVGSLYDASFGSVDAMVKSTAILFRGAHALHTTALGFVCMAIEEAGSATSALQSTGATSQRIRLATTLTELAMFRASSRMLMFSMMCTEVAEEAAAPLVRRTSATLDRLSEGAAA